MTATRTRLIEILSDGGFHSGESLGAKLGVSRMAVWKHLKSLRESGMSLDIVRGKGYRLPDGIELLDSERIDTLLREETRRRLGAMELCLDVDSTNTRLRERTLDGAENASVCLAELQHAGRGTRGRNWVSPFAASLYLSLLWRTSAGVAGLGGMSIAVGVALVRALRQSGIDDAVLKWPNDIMVNDKKLGGVLIDVLGEASGPCAAVIGIGLNVRMPDGLEDAIGRPWTDVSRVTGQANVSRNRLAADVLDALLPAMEAFDHDGLKPFLNEWRRLDMLQGKPVSLQLPDRVVTGTACGIDAGGALLVETGSGRQRFATGEASLGCMA